MFRGWFLRVWGESENRRPLIPHPASGLKIPVRHKSPASALKTPSSPASRKIQPSPQQNRRSLRCVAATSRQAGSASLHKRPPPPKLVPAAPVKLSRRCAFRKSVGPLRCLRAPTGWTSPPTHLRENHENTRVRIEEVATSFAVCPRSCSTRAASCFRLRRNVTNGPANRSAPASFHSGDLRYGCGKRSLWGARCSVSALVPRTSTSGGLKFRFAGPIMPCGG